MKRKKTLEWSKFLFHFLKLLLTFLGLTIKSFLHLSREQRKWIDKQNKAMRVKRKKEEMVRIRSLVDLAYSMDPRVAAFKQEEIERKAAAKKAKQDAVRAARAEQEKVQLYFWSCCSITLCVQEF